MVAGGHLRALVDGDVDGVALAADLRAPVAQVQVLDVEREDLRSPGGGLIQHPGQDLQSQLEVLAGEEVRDVAAG
jgi:hypothetical protein